MGLLTLGLALLIVLSPNGAISTRVRTAATWTATAVVAGTVVVIINRLIVGGSSILGRVWFTLFDKVPALILAGAALTILRNLDGDR